METYNENIGNKLNTLLEKTYDAEKGFRNAKENVDRTDLKTFFETKTQERYNFGHELKAEMKKFGQEIDKGGSVSGTIHRGWMDFKSLFAGDNDEAILEEAIRGEKSAIEEYEDVLSETSLPISTSNLLRSQLDTIRKTLSTVEKMEAFA